MHTTPPCVIHITNAPHWSTTTSWHATIPLWCATTIYMPVHATMQVPVPSTSLWQQGFFVWMKIRGTFPSLQTSIQSTEQTHRRPLFCNFLLSSRYISINFCRRPCVAGTSSAATWKAPPNMKVSGCFTQFFAKNSSLISSWHLAKAATKGVAKEECKFQAWNTLFREICGKTINLLHYRSRQDSKCPCAVPVATVVNDLQTAWRPLRQQFGNFSGNGLFLRTFCAKLLQQEILKSYSIKTPQNQDRIQPNMHILLKFLPAPHVFQDNEWRLHTQDKNNTRT